jgi:N-acetylmuramoyl-L-alanine amidase
MNKIFFFFIFLLFSCKIKESYNTDDVLYGKIICIDAGHGGTADVDWYRKGPTGEREEWINLRIAKLLRDSLTKRGAIVYMTRIDDRNVSLEERVKLALNYNVQIFLSIHHNAADDTTINFPIVFFNGNYPDNKKSVFLGNVLLNNFKKYLFNNDSNCKTVLVSDHVIYPDSGTYILRKLYNIPAVIGEASFYSNPEGEALLKDLTYNKKEVCAYVASLETYFNDSQIENNKPYTSGKVGALGHERELKTSNKDKRNWLYLYNEGMAKLKIKNKKVQYEGRVMLRKSLMAFSTSYLAKDILIALSNGDTTSLYFKRAQLYYGIK